MSRLVPGDAITVQWRMPRLLRAATHSFAEALFADHDGAPPPARLEWMLDEVEDFLGRAGLQCRTIFQASITAVTTLAPISIGRVGPLGRLSIEERQRAVERFEQTPLGLAVLGAKAMCCIVYYEHPEMSREIGYDGQCLGEGAHELSQR